MLQVGVRLLRSCAGHARLVHSARCNLPASQEEALAHFDFLLWSCLTTLAGLHFEAAQAANSFAHLASVEGCAQACQEMDPTYLHLGRRTPT